MTRRVDVISLAYVGVSDRSVPPVLFASNNESFDSFVAAYEQTRGLSIAQRIELSAEKFACIAGQVENQVANKGTGLLRVQRWSPVGNVSRTYSSKFALELLDSIDTCLGNQKKPKSAIQGLRVFVSNAPEQE